MALRNAILLGLKNPMVYQKCLEENQDTLTADRVIEIATDIYNSDCQRSIMQTLSTASAAATGIQQGSTQLHKLQGNHQEDGKSEKGHGKNFTSQDKDGMKRQNQARTERSNKLKCMTCRHNQWREIASLQSTHIQAPTCRLNRSSSTQVSQHCFTIFRRIMLTALMTLQAKHIKPLWLSAASEGPIHPVECEIDTGAGCNVMPLYVYKSLSGVN